MDRLKQHNKTLETCCGCGLLLCPFLGFAGSLWMARYDFAASVWILVGGLAAPFVPAILMAIFRKKQDPPDLGELVSRRWRERTGGGRPARSERQNVYEPHGKHAAAKGIFGACFAFSVLWIPISPILGLIGYQYMEPRIGETAGWFTIGGIVGAFIPIILMVILIAIFHKYQDQSDAETFVFEPPSRRESFVGITLGKIAMFTLKAGYYAVWALITMCVFTPNDRTPKN